MDRQMARVLHFVVLRMGLVYLVMVHQVLGLHCIWSWMKRFRGPGQDGSKTRAMGKRY